MLVKNILQILQITVTICFYLVDKRPFALAICESLELYRYIRINQANNSALNIYDVIGTSISHSINLNSSFLLAPPFCRLFRKAAALPYPAYLAPLVFQKIIGNPQRATHPMFFTRYSIFISYFLAISKRPTKLSPAKTYLQGKGLPSPSLHLQPCTTHLVAVTQHITRGLIQPLNPGHGP
jgi:hypothetical protein